MVSSIASSSTLFCRSFLPPIRTITPHSNLHSSLLPSTPSNTLSFGSRRSEKRGLRKTAPVLKFTVTCGAGGVITEIDETQFSDAVMKSDVPVLVEFVANWCGPCRLISPVIESIAQEYKDRLTIVKIDHDANPKLIEEYKVYGLPTLILFKKGKFVPDSRREGAITKVKLKEYIDSLLESTSVL